MALLLYSNSAPYRSVNARGQAANRDDDYSAGRYFYNGLYYPSEAAKNTAMGATKNGVSLQMPIPAGFSVAEFSAEIRGTTPSGTTGVQVIRQFDDGSENNRLRIEYDRTNSTFYSYVTIGGTSTKKALGTRAASSSFIINLTATTRYHGFAAWLDGNSIDGSKNHAKYTALASTPSFTYVRDGCDSSGGSLWTGTITRSIDYADRDRFGDCGADDGDSYTGGSTGIHSQMMSVTGRTFVPGGGGLGGSTLLGEFTAANEGYRSAIPWSSGISFNVNDVTILNGIPYVCKVANTNQTPPNATYWGDPGILWRMQWTLEYGGADCVFMGWDGNAPGNEFASTDTDPAKAAAYCDRWYYGYKGMGGLRNFRDWLIRPPMVIRITGVSEAFNIAVRDEMLYRNANDPNWFGKVSDWHPNMLNDGTYVDDSLKNPPGGDTEGHVSPDARSAQAAADEANLIGRGL